MNTASNNITYGSTRGLIRESRFANPSLSEIMPDAFGIALTIIC